MKDRTKAEYIDVVDRSILDVAYPQMLDYTDLLEIRFSSERLSNGWSAFAVVIHTLSEDEVPCTDWYEFFSLKMATEFARQYDY